MAKITRRGPSDARTPADTLRELGKLGPYVEGEHGPEVLNLPEGNVVEADEDVEAELPRPGQNDPKAAWVAYAESLGVEDAESKTKADLIELTYDDTEEA